MIISSDKGRILGVLIFCGENSYLPSMIFYYRKSQIKFGLGQNVFNCQPILKIFAAHFRTNQAPKSEEEINFSQLNEIENIREIPLSEGNFYTLA